MEDQKFKRSFRRNAIVLFCALIFLTIYSLYWALSLMSVWVFLFAIFCTFGLGYSVAFYRYVLIRRLVIKPRSQMTTIIVVIISLIFCLYWALALKSSWGFLFALIFAYLVGWHIEIYIHGIRKTLSK